MYRVRACVYFGAWVAEAYPQRCSLSCSESFFRTSKALSFLLLFLLFSFEQEKSVVSHAHFFCYTIPFSPSLFCAVRGSDSGINTTAATYIAPPFPFLCFTPPSVPFARPLGAGIGLLGSFLRHSHYSRGAFVLASLCVCGFFPSPVNGYKEERTKRNGAAEKKTASALSLFFLPAPS